MNDRFNRIHEPLERSLRTQSTRLVQVFSGAESGQEEPVDFTNRMGDTNQLRYMEACSELPKVLIELFKTEFPKVKEAIFKKFEGSVKGSVGHGRYRAILQQLYVGALNRDEEQVELALGELYRQTRSAFESVLDEPLPRDVDSVRTGVRGALRLDAATRAQLGAGGEWAGHQLEQSADAIRPLWGKEGGSTIPHSAHERKGKGKDDAQAA